MQQEALPATVDEARALLGAGKVEMYERALKALALSPDPQASRRATALLGLFYFDQKRLDEALPLLTRGTAAYPEVAPYLRLRIIEANRIKGDFAGAIGVANALIQQTPASSAATIARMQLPALYQMQGDSPSADIAMVDVGKINIDELTEGDLVELATQLAKAGREELATQIRMRLLTQFTQGRFTEQTYGQLTALAKSPLDALSFDDSLNLAAKLGNHDRYDQEFDLLRRIAERFPEINGGQAPSPLLREEGSGEAGRLSSTRAVAYRNVRWRALFSTRKYNDLVAEAAGQGVVEPNVMLMVSRAAWRANKPQDFLAGLKRLERDFPDSKEAAEAKILRAKYYVTDEVDEAKAVDNLQKAIDAGAYGNEGENLWTLGWTYTLAKRWDDALRTFERYGRTFPDGDYLTNSLFWTAKILRGLGQTEASDTKLREIVQKYPYSYYAYRAREIMNDPTLPAEVANGSVFPDVDAQLAALIDPRLTAVKELAWLGLMRDATRETKSIAAAYPDNLGVAFMLADLYVQGGEPFKANGVLQKRFRNFVRHGGSNIPTRFWQILFPLNYWESIKSEGEKQQVDPYVIASIIRQESGFEPSVVSNAGAVGIMQIMPEEAARIAERAGLASPSRQDLFDPKVNIAIGAAEFAQKLAAMNGKPPLAIAAYNAGEEAVGRWLAHTPVDDMDLFVESIPYAETRLYVKSVTRNRSEYRRIYEGSTRLQQQAQMQ